MKDLKAQLAEMSLDQLISATHSQILKTEDEKFAAYVTELLHRMPRLRERNRELQRQLDKANLPQPAVSAEKLRKQLRQSTGTMRAVCNHIDALANQIR